MSSDMENEGAALLLIERHGILAIVLALGSIRDLVVEAEPRVSDDERKRRIDLLIN